MSSWTRAHGETPSKRRRRTSRQPDRERAAAELLLAWQLDYLKARGIPVAVAVLDEGYENIEGLLRIPLWRPGDDRATSHQDITKDGKKLTAAGKGNVLHVPRSRENPRRVTDGKEPLYIAESPLKALAVVLRGGCAVGLCGVDSWRTER